MATRTKDDPVAFSRRHPLTPAQQMFWAAHVLHPDHPVDNRVMKIEWRLELDINAFTRALQVLVERCDSLRLVFGEAHGIPFQYAAPDVDPALEIRDFSNEAEPFVAANEWLDRRSARVLDLSRKVFESALARLGPDHWIWHLNQHHIATDFTSAALILQRLSDLYEQALKGAIAPDPQYPSYLEFLAAHPMFVDSGHEDKTAPRQRLPVPPRLFDIAARTSESSALGNTRMVRFETHLGPERLSRIRAFLRIKSSDGDTRHRVLLFNLFTTVLLAFTARATGQRAVTVGTPSHNRYLDGSENVAGLFIRMLPIHVEIEEEWSFLDLNSAIQKECRRIFAAAKAGAPTPTRRYNVVINYIPTAMPTFHGIPSSDLTATRVTDAVGLDLSLTIRAADTPGDIKLMFDLNEEILQVLDGKDLSSQFMRILDAMLDEPATRPDTVALYHPAARVASESAARRAFEAPPPRFRSLPQAFAAQARRTPGAIAVREGEITLSYADLETRVDAVATGLRRYGVDPDAIVAVQIPRSLDLVVAILGIMRAGAVYCPLDIWGPEERASWILADTGALVVLVRRDVKLSPAFDSVEPIIIEDLLAGSPDVDSEHPLEQIVPQGRAYIMYTSGTTGTPKGVMVSHESFARYLQWRTDDIFRGEPVSFAFTAQITFDASLRCFAAIYGGGSIDVYTDAKRAGDFVLARVLEEDAVDAIMATPSQLRFLVDRMWTLSRLRWLNIVGEPLPTTLAIKARNALGTGVEILNCYGPTEATLVSTFHNFDPDRDTAQTVPLGRTAPDVSIHILDAGLNPVPDGMTGEIHIGGARLALGYLNNPELTRTKFIPDPFYPGGRLYRTGDLGYIDQDGNLFYHSRIDSQFKINGIRAELAEVENAVCGHPRVTGCAVGFSEEPPQRLVAWYVAEEEIPAGRLRAAAAKYVTGALIPAFFMRIDALPLTPNGKIDRRALPPVDLAHKSVREPLPPRTVTEEALVALWSRILDTDSVGIDDDFADLGGDSLAAIRVMYETEEQFNIRIPVESIDRITTIASFAAVVDEMLSRSEADGDEASETQPTLIVTDRMTPEASSPQGVDPDLLRRLQIFMTGWEGERADNAALMFQLNTKGSLPPLFWCFNNQHEFSEMARHLGPNQPVYGVRSLKGVVKTKAEKVIQDRLIAARYVDELLSLHSDGPFFIGGNCQATRVAMWMARHLIDRGKPVGLLCLMEQVPLLPYPGRVALFFGRDSDKHNQFKKFTTPEIGWRRFYRDVVWEVVPGRHGEFFREPNVAAVCERIAVRLAEAQDVAPVPLPAEAYAARLELPGSIEPFGPGERRRLRVQVHNLSTIKWHAGDNSGIFLVNRWLDEYGTILAHLDGAAPLPEMLVPGDSCEITLDVMAPGHCGRLVLEIDLSEEGVAFFSERGVRPLHQEVRVARSASRGLAPTSTHALASPTHADVSIPAADTVNHSRTYREAGMQAARLGRYDSGARLLEQSTDEAFSLFFELGQCQLRAGAPRPAIHSFRLALRIRPRNAETKQALAEARRNLLAQRWDRLVLPARRAARVVVRKLTLKP